LFYLNKIKKSNINKTFLIILGFYSVFTFFSILKRVYAGNASYTSAKWLNFIFENYLIEYFLVLIFASLVVISCKEMIKYKFSWLRTFFIHIGLASFLGIFLYFGFALFQNAFIPNFRVTYNAFLNYYINSLDSNFLIYLSMVGVYYTIYHIEKEKVSRINSKILKRTLSNTTLKVLKYQNQPNLLFSGLNSISSLMKNDVLLAQNTTDNLGEYLRDTLKFKDKNLVSVGDEIRLTNKYINIIKTRYGDKLQIKFKADKNVENCLIPSLILQPLIENEIKSDISINEDPLLINIKIIKKSNMIKIIIKSMGISNKNNNLNNLKINNLNLIQRLQLHYKNDYSLSSKNILNGKLLLIQFPCKPENLN